MSDRNEGLERRTPERPVEEAEVRLETDRPLITDPRSSQLELTEREAPKASRSDLQMRPSAEKSEVFVPQNGWLERMGLGEFKELPWWFYLVVVGLLVGMGFAGLSAHNLVRKT